MSIVLDTKGQERDARRFNSMTYNTQNWQLKLYMENY